MKKRAAPAPSENDIPHNMNRRDMIRATDFNMIMVLGKGSFGKVLLAERKVCYFYNYNFLKLIKLCIYFR